MENKPYPVFNDEGRLFCKASRTVDGKDILLIGKNCSISLKELQEKAEGQKLRKQRGRRLKEGYKLSG